MTKNFMLFVVLFWAFAANAQSTVGLIAHWDMNGTTNDVSGNGHNGHAHNLTPAAGIDGVMGSAWYFNGTNSGITIPYAVDLNVSNFTISTTIKVMGFYTGTCHGNVILSRGTSAGTGIGSYIFEYSDYPAGYGCTPGIDTTQESFLANVCATGTSLMAATLAPFDYSPHIVENKWYTVVITFNDTVYKVYVNNVLAATETITTPGVPIGLSTDSASIGYCVYDSSIGYPYWIDAVIDDIRFYNRVLSDSEIIKLNPATLEVPDIPVGSAISVYPDPVHNELTISAPQRITQITITDLVGRAVYNHYYDNEEVQIDVSNLPTGMYLARINGSEVRKFIKQ